MRLEDDDPDGDLDVDVEKHEDPTCARSSSLSNVASNLTRVRTGLQGGGYLNRVAIASPPRPPAQMSSIESTGISLESIGDIANDRASVKMRMSQHDERPGSGYDVPPPPTNRPSPYKGQGNTTLDHSDFSVYQPPPRGNALDFSGILPDRKGKPQRKPNYSMACIVVAGLVFGVGIGFSIALGTLGGAESSDGAEATPASSPPPSANPPSANLPPPWRPAPSPPPPPRTLPQPPAPQPPPSPVPPSPKFPPRPPPVPSPPPYPPHLSVTSTTLAIDDPAELASLAAAHPAVVDVAASVTAALGSGTGGSLHELDWVIPMEPQSLTVVGGDTVRFTWSGYHNVYRSATQTDYDLCAKSGGVMVGPSAVGGSYSETFPYTLTGTFYYICEETTHCDHGQKITITVVAPGTDVVDVSVSQVSELDLTHSASIPHAM